MQSRHEKVFKQNESCLPSPSYNTNDKRRRIGSDESNAQRQPKQISNQSQGQSSSTAEVSMLERTLKSTTVPRLLSTIATVQSVLATSSTLPLMMESTLLSCQTTPF